MYQVYGLNKTLNSLLTLAIPTIVESLREPTAFLKFCWLLLLAAILFQGTKHVELENMEENEKRKVKFTDML